MVASVLRCVNQRNDGVSWPGPKNYERVETGDIAGRHLETEGADRLAAAVPAR